jgi:hypothetical protein
MATVATGTGLEVNVRVTDATTVVPSRASWSAVRVWAPSRTATYSCSKLYVTHGSTIDEPSRVSRTVEPS